MRKTLNRLLWGLLFITAGIGYIGRLAGFWENFTIFFPGWWTLFLIIPMLFSIINDRPNWFNISILLLGVGLLLSNDAYNIFQFKDFIWIALAAILILIGIRIIFAPLWTRAATKRKNRIVTDDGTNTGYRTDEASHHYSVSFGDARESFEGREFLGAEVNAVFGSFTLDLRGAIINRDAVIDIDAAFGSVEVLVPSDVNIRTSGDSFFGATSNSRTAEADSTKPTLFIKCDAAFGGITIK